MKCKYDCPESHEYDDYYQKYIDNVHGNVIQQLTDQADIYTEYIKDNAHRMDYKYGPDKWTIRESLVHVIDTEQIFAYRALRVGRGDTTPMEGYDHNGYIANNDFSHIGPWDILEEFTHQRRATISMLKKMTQGAITTIGTANNSPVSARALAYMIAGHAEHHLQLFRERYSE